MQSIKQHFIASQDRQKQIMNSKYRSVDTTQNIIISTKNMAGQYVPYRTNFKYQPSLKSLKKPKELMQNNFKNCRVFEKSKFPKRVLSKNDRLDLYLSGGQALDPQISQSQTNPYKVWTQENCENRVFFRGGKIKRKQFMSTVRAQHNIFRNQIRTFYQSSQKVKDNNVSYNNKNLNLSSKNIVTRKEFPKLDTSVKNQQQWSINCKIKDPLCENQNCQRSNTNRNQQQQINNGLCSSLNELRGEDHTSILTIFRKKKHGSLNYNNNSRKSDLNKPSKKNSDKRHSESAKQKFQNSRSNKNFNDPVKRDEKAQALKKPLFYFNQKQLMNIKAQSFIVTEYPSGQVLTGNYFRKFAEIASLTKIMTFYAVYHISVTYDVDLEQSVQIDQQVQSISGTSAELYAGQIFTAKQLLYGLMLPSGNDAATALAKWAGAILAKHKWQNTSPIKIFESEKQPLKLFLSYINRLAKDINMPNSRFFNPHGLPNSQSGSTPLQMSILINQCLKIQLFRQIVKTKVYTCYTRNQYGKRQAVWQNTNKLLRRKNFIGVKTGVTVSAGPCLATCYQSGDKIFIVILLRTTKLSRRFKQTRMILGLTLGKLNYNLYGRQIKQIVKQDKQLDSDNSEDEMEFQFDKNDQKQMAKRNKILTYQM